MVQFVKWLYPGLKVKRWLALASYRKERAFPVEPDLERIQALGYSVIPGDFVSADDHVRHDPARLARVIIRLGMGSRRGAPRRRTGGNRPAGTAQLPLMHLLRNGRIVDARAGGEAYEPSAASSNGT